MNWDKLKLNFLETTDMNYESIKFHNIILKAETFDDDGQGKDYYTLYQTSYWDYILIHSWSRGWDQWGYHYKCNTYDLTKVVQENNNNHPFIVILKDYLRL